MSTTSIDQQILAAAENDSTRVDAPPTVACAARVMYEALCDADKSLHEAMAKGVLWHDLNAEQRHYLTQAMQDAVLPLSVMLETYPPLQPAARVEWRPVDTTVHFEQGQLL